MPTPSSNTNIFMVYLPFASENILLAFAKKYPPVTRGTAERDKKGDKKRY